MLRVDGFQVRIYLPPREHGPAHVHVIKGDHQVLIDLNTPAVGVMVRRVVGMSRPDVHHAVALVAAHAQSLRNEWRKYHG